MPCNARLEIFVISLHSLSIENSIANALCVILTQQVFDPPAELVPILS
jgi:hypothetical protein